MESLHTQFLSMNLYWTILEAQRGNRPIAKVLLLPLSWRNPDVVAMATVASLLHLLSHKDTPREIIIAGLADTSPFRYVLEDHASFLQTLEAWRLQPRMGKAHIPFRRDSDSSETPT
jgi:hypothetical protein